MATTPELVLMEVGLTAIVRALGRRRAMTFLETMSDELTEIEARVKVRRVSMPAEDRERADAGLAALEWFKGRLPEIMATMPRD